MVINPDTKSKIKGYLEGFIQGLIEQFKGKTFDTQNLALAEREQLATEGELKPFHEVILPPELRRISRFERSFSSKLGNTFEESARCIGIQVHKDAKRGYRMEGDIPDSAVGRIQEIRAEIDDNGFVKTFPELANELLLRVSTTSQPRTTHRRTKADLYILMHDGSEWFFEIKSPEPNKGQCLEVVERLLLFQTIQKSRGRSAKTYYAMAYNPYGTRERYSWRNAQYLDLENEVLLQEEFWTIVGNHRDTYKELIDIYAEVGRDKGKDMLDQLAFDF